MKYFTLEQRQQERGRGEGKWGGARHASNSQTNLCRQVCASKKNRENKEKNRKEKHVCFASSQLDPTHVLGGLPQGS